MVNRFFDGYIYNIETVLPQTPGIFLLGMHRSSTSMLSGLVVKGLGYEIGGLELPAADDNPKGFFERTDVVDMNNAFLNSQNMTWDNHEKIIGYSISFTIEHLQSGLISNASFASVMEFYNGYHKVPYLQKDPRSCLTLPVWMKYLNHRPAVLFTYRHPLEVAMSLQKRDNFPLIKGFSLWIIYNVLAVQYSNGYCRVVTSSEAIVHNTLQEMARISHELTSRCHVLPSVNETMSSDVVDDFVDHTLQHATNRVEQQPTNATIIHDFGHKCIATKFTSSHETGSNEQMKEEQLYLMAMDLFCSFKSGLAFGSSYEMPNLSTMNDPY